MSDAHADECTTVRRIYARTCAAPTHTWAHAVPVRVVRTCARDDVGLHAFARHARCRRSLASYYFTTAEIYELFPDQACDSYAYILLLSRQSSHGAVVLCIHLMVTPWMLYVCTSLSLSLYVYI